MKPNGGQEGVRLQFVRGLKGKPFGESAVSHQQRRLPQLAQGSRPLQRQRPDRRGSDRRVPQQFVCLRASLFDLLGSLPPGFCAHALGFFVDALEADETVLRHVDGLGQTQTFLTGRGAVFR
ncbi:hypothetical protein [Streptomyces chartreusis]|uniref:hypothetical protein n=1 Tax=Streptomyces chartreusis TaxID=1969 RepID=UPI0037FDF6A4